jgi:hypothetical protein
MLHARIRSRGGNIMLAAIGAIYAVTAAILLVRWTMDLGSPPAIRELIVIAALLAAGACGVRFFLDALENLRIQIPLRLVHRDNTPRPV